MLNLFIALRTFLKVPFILAIVILINSCSSDIPKEIKNPNSIEYKKIEISQDQIELIKLKVNKVKERRIYSQFTTNIIKSGGREALVEKITFDNNGNRKEQYRYRSNGIEVQWLYDYDEFGNEKSIEEYDGFHMMLNITVFTYSSNGILQEKRVENKNNKSYYEYTYDENYNLANVNIFNKNKVLHSKSFYRYSSGLLDSLLFYQNSRLVKIIKFEFDSLQRQIKESIIANNKIIGFTSYEYDNRGNISRIIEQKVNEMHYSFDLNKNILEEKHFDNSGNLQSRTTYQYDTTSDLLLSKIRYDGNDVPALNIRYEYGYY